MTAKTLSVPLNRLDYIFRAIVFVGVLEFVALAFDLITHPYVVSPASNGPFIFRVISGLMIAPLTMLIAALILWRVPGNVIGGFLALFVIGFTGWQFTFDSGVTGLLPPAFLVFYLYWGAVGFPAILYLLLNFPTGHIYPPGLSRWVVLYALVKVFGGLLEILSVKPGPNNLALPVNANPVFIPSLGPLHTVISASIGNQGAILLVGILIVITSLVARYRQARDQERQQIKWVAWFAGIVMILAVIWAVPKIAFGVRFSSSSLLDLATYAALESLPILSIGIAILRYKLFDIDLLINRSLVYVPLTAIIAGVFAASISLSQRLLFAFTGQQSDVTTAFATLVTVAAFDPVKTRLQAVVDKRFKEAPVPAKRLKAFGDHVQSVLQVVDTKQLATGLLDEAVIAFGAKGGAIFLRNDGRTRLSHTSGDWDGHGLLSAVLQSDGMEVGEVCLAARRDGNNYSAQDHDTLQQTANVVARALTIAYRGTVSRESIG